LALGVVLPTVVYQTGDDVQAYVPDAETLPAAALGDLAFTAKATLLPSGPLGGFAVAALARLSLPTGNSTSYASESAATGELKVLGELGLVALTLRASAGMKVRGAEQTFAGEEFGHDLPWAVGISVLPQAFGIDDEGHWLWTIESRGAIALTPSFGAKDQSPAALGLSARYGFGDFALLGSGELAIADAIGAPQARAVLSFSFAPRLVDTDEDGVADEKDECVELAEDRDNFQDADGCPDFDNDDDGVPDENDKCPSEREDTDEFQDDDGCVDPDNDRDGVADAADKCPGEPGPATGQEPGCPFRDGDLDGIPEPEDKCPTQAEDQDAFEDKDGCPDPDDDGDGVADTEDACRNVAGPARSEPEIHGCPSPDRDGDSFDDAADKCPEQAEDFDGKDDLDGCVEADGPAARTAQLEPSGTGRLLKLQKPVVFRADGGLDPKSEPVLRAIAALLNEQPDVVLMVGVKPQGANVDAEQLALNKSFAIVEALRRYTHRDEVAETIAFSAVRRLPGIQNGIGFLVLSTPAEPAAEGGRAAPAGKTR
jgi:hypothetical protein